MECGSNLKIEGSNLKKFNNILHILPTDVTHLHLQLMYALETIKTVLAWQYYSILVGLLALDALLANPFLLGFAVLGVASALIGDITAQLEL
jgi:hypothetical protein